MLAAALLLAVQSSAPAAQPDISIHARVDARSARARSSGESKITATASPDAGSTATSSGRVESGRFELKIDARIADPLKTIVDETLSPSRR